MKVIGIDIGMRGALAISDDGIHIVFHKMPLTKEVRKNKKRRINTDILSGIIKEQKPDLITYEDVGLIFGSSKYTAFHMGYQKGIIEGICKSLDIPFIQVKAMSWQQYMFNKYKEVALYDKNRKNTKESSINIVNHLINKKRIRVYNSLGKEIMALRKSDDGIADAINILKYTYFMFKNEEYEFCN